MEVAKKSIKQEHRNAVAQNKLSKSILSLAYTQSCHSTTVIKMVEPLSKDYTHYFIAEDASLNKIHYRPLLHSLTLGSQILF